MKHIPFNRLKNQYRFLIVFSVLFCIPLTFCSDDPVIWKKKALEQVAGDFISTNPEYSEFSKLVELTGLDALLKIRGPYTVFLPTNDAMFAYYAEKNISGLNDLDAETRSQLIRNHIIADEIASGDIGLGAIRTLNALGDYLVSEFQGSEIVLNKTSKIVKRDIRTANGYIQVIDHVLEPVTKDIFTIISSNPSFQIFTEGLRKTGIKDTLQLISFPFGSKIARTRFTLLAVPDSIYNRFGINNVDDLISWCGASSSDDLTKLDNPFYRYIEYHCLNKSFYLSDLVSGIYPILSHDNNVSFTIADDYKINFNTKTLEYTSFIIPASNIPAKNGAIHCIDGLMPVTEPEPATITFETTDYFDFQQGDYIGKYYMKWHDGQNSFEKIKFGGDYLLYYYKVNHGRTPILNYDCLSMIGFWWIEITTPKIMKGRYTVSGNIWAGGEDLPVFAAYVDGKKVTTINARISNASMNFCDVNWLKTEEHKIKLVCTSWGSLFWDSVIFTPIK
jgi:uncharacterized surface protein with fasciclin (FAS1) repeats